MNVGLFFRIDATWGKEDELARYLEADLPRELEELPTAAWFAVRFSATSFGVFHAFPAIEGQDTHVGDRIAAALREHADLWDQTPVVEGFDVLAERLPQSVSP
jgi:hypothetical protein